MPQRPNVALLVREIERGHPAARLPFSGELVAAPPDMAVVWISEALHEIYRIVPGQILRLPLLGRARWRSSSAASGATIPGSSAPWSISREDYEHLGGRFQPTDLALWPRPGQEAAATTWLAPYAGSTDWKWPKLPRFAG
jgi:hypothetical protein